MASSSQSGSSNNAFDSVLQHQEGAGEGQVEFKVYVPSSRSPAIPQSLPDEYFTPTPADLKSAQAVLSARTQALVNAPLQLRTVRDANEKVRRDRWPQTTIRVRFTDRTLLERVFPSTDKIRSVYAFVRNCLQDDVKPVKFILYQSPPKRDLKVSDPHVRDMSLAELHLAPSSVLLLRFEDDSLNKSNFPAPLSPSILQGAKELPAPPTEPAFRPVDEARPSTAVQAQPSSQNKIPKWMKIGHRK